MLPGEEKAGTALAARARTDMLDRSVRVRSDPPSVAQPVPGETSRRGSAAWSAAHGGQAMLIHGFTVTEEVYRGRTRVVYRGRRDRDGVSVILKTFTDGVPASVAGASLRREYDLIKDLDVPGVARAYCLVAGGDAAALVLEDVGGERLKTLLAAGRLDLGTTLRLGVQ